MGPYDSKLCIPPTNNHLLAVQQQPLVLNEKYWSSGEEEKKKGKKKKGMRMDNQPKSYKTERATGLSKRNEERRQEVE